MFELNTQSYRMFCGLSEYPEIIEIGWTELELVKTKAPSIQLPIIMLHD